MQSHWQPCPSRKPLVGNSEGCTRAEGKKCFFASACSASNSFSVCLLCCFEIGPCFVAQSCLELDTLSTTALLPCASRTPQEVCHKRSQTLAQDSLPCHVQTWAGYFSLLSWVEPVLRSQTGTDSSQCGFHGFLDFSVVWAPGD